MLSSISTSGNRASGFWNASRYSFTRSTDISDNFIKYFKLDAPDGSSIRGVQPRYTWVLTGLLKSWMEATPGDKWNPLEHPGGPQCQP